MALPLPSSLSPSKVASFKECALAFRLSVIERIQEPPSALAVKGTLVHRALELLMWEEEPAHRTRDAALEKLIRAVPEVMDGPENAPLTMTPQERDDFVADAASLVHNYFLLEDPSSVRVIGTELRMSAEIGTLTMTGIIDRLELDDDGELVVTDYKTGRAPSASFEQPRLGGVHFYAFLCEKILGRRPKRIQLLHLREPMVISTVPTDSSIRALERQAAAIWAAVEQACAREDFRPRPGRLCDHCSFHDLCPAFGGSLAGLAAPPAMVGSPAA